MVKTLSTLVEGNMNTDSDSSAAADRAVKKNPRRRNRRKNGRSIEEPTVVPEVRNFSAVLRAGTRENHTESEDDESLRPESTTSQQEADRSESGESARDEEDATVRDGESFRQVNKRRHKKRSINIIGDVW